MIVRLLKTDKPISLTTICIHVDIKSGSCLDWKPSVISGMKRIYCQSPNRHFSVVRPGDVKYKDQNEDERIDSEDRIAIGKVYNGAGNGVRLESGLNIKALEWIWSLMGEWADQTIECGKCASALT